ncbi:SGNH/GDSL hydrolase family protein [Alicyclobacillus sp.]|uniref:SGNH/GDSL hydrolase family protein n=1 Tax=Alicyclobacillus sp. TaxID=61169 RepID=UPI0025C0542C|nr:SGNH/GDSL hydrolase family protein [Alicyclobacillus sp.]MCL6517283.1 SGNH/GDSL hydrolase family protein [Alicyclobacillus sp.]
MPRDVYLALGDGIPAGLGASHPGLSFVRHVTSFVKERSIARRTVVIAQPGLTVKHLFEVVRTIQPAFWETVRIATLSIGSADLARLLKPRRLTLDGNPFPPRAVIKKADEFGYHTDQLFQLIRERHLPHVLVTTLYNPFPSCPPAVRFVEGMNGIRRDCAAYHHFEIVDLDDAFRDNEAYLIQGYRTGDWPDLLQPVNRPMFPNNAGHKLIAHLITRHLGQRFRAKSRRSGP